MSFANSQKSLWLVVPAALALLASALLAQRASAEQAAAAAVAQTGEALEASGAVIGSISLNKRNVFDLTKAEEDKWLYRWANRLHTVTRDRVLLDQLLFETGDAYSAQQVNESARILRRNRYLFDADITPVNYRNGTVDIEVTTQDVWSLTPDLSFSRNGGENRTAYGIEETNLLGRGQLVRLKRIEDVDRESNLFEFEDTQLGSSWISLFVRLADNSDGNSHALSIVRPFHSLDSRWTAGVTALADERRTALYRLGDEAAEFRHERELYTAFGGLSAGLRHGWVRRWTAGVVYDDNVFSEEPDATLPAAVPENRKLVYPFVRFELLQDKFEASSNINRMGRTEDFYLGTLLAASLGWSDTGFGADRDALIVAVSVSQGFGSLNRTSLFLAAGLTGRSESGRSANTRLQASARYFQRQSEKRLFSFSVSGVAGNRLDLDAPVQLGGDSGLRGYPLRYQSGDSKLLFSMEQRYFTDWYPFRLFRVGGAIFADVGRIWGDNPIGEPRRGWLKDVGLGFRFAPTRFSTSKIVHLDFAFPLDGDDSIDSLQVTLEAKRSF